MALPAPYRPPVPLFVPALVATLILFVLVIFGWREQRHLAADNAEQLIQQREQIAHIVAEAIETDLLRTIASAERYAHDLAMHLAEPDTRAAARFDQTFETLPDGSIRSRRARFDPSRHAGVVLPSYLTPTPSLQEFFVRARDFTEIYGRGAQGRAFVDTWLLAAPGGEVIYWPEEPEFIYVAPADFDYRDTEWVVPTRPERNPNRRPYWTKLAFDPVPKIWMLSAVAPFYWRNEWFGSVGHDVPLAKLLNQTNLLRQQSGSEFILLTADGIVAASDTYADAIKAQNGELMLDALPNPIWKRVVNAAETRVDRAPQHQRVTFAEHVAFVSHIRGQNWLLINVLPLQPISARIDDSFVSLRNIAVGTLLFVMLLVTGLMAFARLRSRQYFAKLTDIQQQLAVSESHYRNLVANIPGMVYRCANDADWTMSFVSPAATELTGYPAAEFLANGVRSFGSIIHAEDQQPVFDTVQVAIGKRQPFTIEYRIQRRDGQLRWVLEYGRPVIHDGVLLALEGVILDVTPLKQAEAKLRELNASLEQQVDQRTTELRSAVHDLETFNYAVSHDLRAPVRHVDGYLSMLQEALADNPDSSIHDLIARSQRALKRMNEMIAGMLALAQLGRESLRPHPIDLTAMVQEILRDVPESTRQALQLELGPLPVVVADRVLLRQVLQNVIDNALKYSQQNAKPLLAIHDRSAGADATEHVIEVRDNGVGFDPEHAASLFTLFRRLHSAEQFPGTGVGLALCAKIIALHGGRIWAESEMGQGARFFIALPRLPLPSNRAEASPS